MDNADLKNTQSTLSDTESYSEIGKLLRRAREEVRMPIDQAARMLHIRLRYLDALEQGRLNELPGLTYTRGYLQAYATFLGLDKDEILRRFEEVEAVLARRNFYFPQVFSKQKTPSRTLVWGGLGAALAIYALWVIVLQPPSTRISVVERFPMPQAQKMRVSAALARDVSCFRPQDGYYPPCTFARVRGLRPDPLHRHYKTVMELAVIDLAYMRLAQP